MKTPAIFLTPAEQDVQIITRYNKEPIYRVTPTQYSKSKLLNVSIDALSDDIMVRLGYMARCVVTTESDDNYAICSINDKDDKLHIFSISIHNCFEFTYNNDIGTPYNLRIKEKYGESVLQYLPIELQIELKKPFTIFCSLCTLYSFMDTMNN